MMLNFKAMKNLLFISLLAIISSFTSPNGKTETLRVKTTTYCDHCMVCETCWARIENELRFTKGVKVAQSTFDEKAMVISVVYDPKKTTPEKIRQAIAKSGFDADDVKADPKGQSKLDTCCKKQ